MGCGKSLVSKLIATEFTFHRCDLDSYIENKHGMIIEDIFAKHGESVFREWERDALLEVANMESMVVSVGGGTPCFFDNMDVMNHSGITVYLQSPAKELIEWLENHSAGRPLVDGLKGDVLERKVRELLIQREPYYMKAKYIVPAGESSIDYIRKIITKENLI